MKYIYVTIIFNYFTTTGKKHYKNIIYYIIF